MSIELNSIFYSNGSLLKTNNNLTSLYYPYVLYVDKKISFLIFF